MNQKKLRKRGLSWLLALSMVLSLFSGESIVPQKAKAASSDAKINFGTAEIHAGYYTYPDVEVTLSDTGKRIHNLTVTVDSGYIKVVKTKIEDNRGTEISGTGILTADSIAEKLEKESDSGLNQYSGIDTLSTDSTSRYESIMFDFDSAYSTGQTSPGVSVSTVNEFLRGLRFTTEDGNILNGTPQKVTVSATSLGTADLTLSSDKVLELTGKQNIQLHYFQGHFYAYVTHNWPASWAITWKSAYDETQQLEFKGVKGYLATLTSRAEDRFILSTFPLSSDGVYAAQGWIGCTRRSMDDIESIASDEKLENMKSANDPNFVWRWATGPEKGTEIGQQTNACAQEGTWGDFYEFGDGGFKAFDGQFANWGDRANGESNIEPNGGGNGTGPEAYGYYGRYKYGRWNDWPANANLSGYYVEFGGMTGDDALFESGDGDVLTEEEQDPFSRGDQETAGPVVSVQPGKKLEGKPVIRPANPDVPVAVGIKLTVDTDNVKPDGVRAGTDYDYQWYVQDDDTGIWKEIPGNENITLTKDLLGHNLKVELIGKGDYEGSVLASDPYDANLTKQEIDGTVTIVPRDDNVKPEDLEAGDVVKADLSDLGPENDVKDDLHYQWYVKDDDGEKKPVGTDRPTYILREEDMGKELTVEVTPGEDAPYTGSVESDPFAVPELPVPSASPQPTKDPYGEYDELEMITGRPSIVNTNDKVDDEGNPVNEVGAVLEANIDEVRPNDAKDSLLYQWYVQEPDGLKPIDGATEPTYTLTADDLDKRIVVSVTGNEDEGYYGTRNSLPYEAAQEKTPITNKPTIKNHTKGTNEAGVEYEIKRAGTVLEAVIDDIDPQDSHKTLEYQWYVKDEDGSLTAIPDATERYLVLTQHEIDKEVVVKATGTGKYKGTVESNPYDTKRTDSDVELGEVDENGKRTITVSPTMEKTIYAIVDADSDGIPLMDIPTVDESGFNVTPNYTYKETPGYYLPGKPGPDGKLVFTVDADKEYVIYAIKLDDDTKDVIIISPDIDVTPNPITPKDPEYDDKGTGSNADDTVTITVDPADEDSKYAVLEKVDGQYVQLPFTYDPEKREYVYDPAGEPIFSNGEEVKVVFSELPAGGTYKVVSIKDNDKIPELTGPIDPNQIQGGSDDIVTETKANVDDPIGGDDDIVIPGKDITPQPGYDYDDKGTDDDKDDTITIVVDPADEDYKYAILKKDEDGNYVDVPLKKDENGKYIYDPDGTIQFTDGGDGKIEFTELPADGTYKVVCVKGDEDTPELTDPVKPGQIQGGSEDITPVKPNDPNQSPNASGAPSASGTPAGPTSGSSVSLTPQEQDNVTKFIQDHLTDPSGNIVTTITDLTKDIVLSGENAWNQLTQTEKNAVNERLKAAGSAYTYEQLLEMAKAYKIPGFKLRKVMKKKTKAKLLLVKCKGAQTVVTTTNSKVATVSKKGIIKAKKVGKATLTITVVKGDYSNRLVINVIVRKKFKNAKELKKFKSKVVKTPTILIAKKRALKKSTKIKIYGLEKGAKVKYKSYNKKALPLNNKGRYTAKKKGKSLMRVTVYQNDKVYYLYLYVTAFKAGGKKKK